MIFLETAINVSLLRGCTTVVVYYQCILLDRACRLFLDPAKSFDISD